MIPSGKKDAEKIFLKNGEDLIGAQGRVSPVQN
jgi:hypothetical protein